MPDLAITNYVTLRAKVRETLLVGQRQVEETKVRTYWETGRLINEHVRYHNGRAEYGRKVLAKLAEDLDIDLSVLRRCSEFAAKFQIDAARHQLSWAHYRTLITVEDEDKRKRLAELAAEKELSSRELGIRIRNLHWTNRIESADGKLSVLLPPPTLGPFYTCRIIRPETIHSKSGDLLIDLGFSTNLELSLFVKTKFDPETIVTAEEADDGYKIKKAEGLDVKSLYTYKAFVERVIDGDTLKVEIDLGFGVRMRQVIRLKSIDAPEMDTADGKAAKKFVEERLVDCEFITLKTTKSDKYDRYLGDVLYDFKGEQRFLNNELLEARHAVRVSYG